jgi:hypothetical protein
MTVSFKSPADGKTFASVPFSFVDIPLGKLVTFDAGGEASSGWLTTVPLTDPEKELVAAGEAYLGAQAAQKKRSADLETLDNDLKNAPALAQRIETAVKAYCDAVARAKVKSKAAPNGTAKQQGVGADDDLNCPFDRYQQRFVHDAWERRIKLAVDLSEPLPVPAPVSQEGLGYATVSVTANETKDASKFWAAVSSSFDSQKTDLNQALAAKLIPAERKTAEQQRHDDEVKLANDVSDRRGAYAEAEVAVTAAKETFAQLPSSASDTDRARAKLSVLKAELSANKAARLADIPIPYPDAER